MSDRRAFKFLQVPCHSVTRFIFDLLTVILISAAIFGVLFAFRGRVLMTTLVEFTGYAIPLIIAISILATTFSMVIMHARHMLAARGGFVLQGVVALILALATGTAIGFTIFNATDPRFDDSIAAFLSVQAILVVVIVFYSAVLKADLMWRIYEFTTHAGIARLDWLRGQGWMSNDEHRDWLRDFRGLRQEELREFELLYEDHLEHLRSAGGSEKTPVANRIA
jgi:hypothetical protein